MIGLDLGTSSVRAFLTCLDKAGGYVAGSDYDVIIPEPGHAEQDPAAWYHKAAEVVRMVVQQSNISPEKIIAISFSGQMHGLVALDERKQPVMNAVLWLDQRSEDAIADIYGKLGTEAIKQNTQNRVSPGFLLASLYWLKLNKNDLYQRIAHVMLPKDYIKFRLSDRITTDFSDAAGSLAFDNVTLKWAEPIIKGLGLREEIFPVCLPSTEVIGHISPDAAADFGLSERTLVVNGGADQCMQAIGNAVIKEGACASNIGTSALICAAASKPLYDPALRGNTFAHVLPDRWSVMAACLNGGSVLKWLSRSILRVEDYGAIDQLILNQKSRLNDLFFMPYLAGERTPYMNPRARGAYVGLTLHHDRADLARAAMEGVVFAMKDSLEVLKEMNVPCDYAVAAGGGARSDVWLQMQADIFEMDVYRSATKEQACLGAAITAAVGVGLFNNFEEACDVCVAPALEVFSPLEGNMAIYRQMYPIFKDLYTANSPIFDRISAMRH